MKKCVVALLATLFVLTACDSDNTICQEDSQCLSFCRAYTASDLLYACTSDGTCQCVADEELECDVDEKVDEGERSHCEDLCDSLKPGTTGVCNKKSRCECTEPTVE